MDVRHDIVPSLLFFLGSDIKLLPVQILHKTPHIKRGGVRNPAFMRGGEG